MELRNFFSISVPTFSRIDYERLFLYIFGIDAVMQIYHNVFSTYFDVFEWKTLLHLFAYNKLI